MKSSRATSCVKWLNGEKTYVDMEHCGVPVFVSIGIGLQKDYFGERI
jgi:hypothetical protein